MRMERVNQQIRREIAFILQQEMSDPRFQFVSITNVDVSKDLRHAKVYFTIFAVKDQQKVQQSLQAASSIIRRYLGQRLTMRFLPELVFVYDNSISDGARIEEQLKEIQNERKDHSSGAQES